MVQYALVGGKGAGRKEVAVVRIECKARPKGHHFMMWPHGGAKYRGRGRCCTSASRVDTVSRLCCGAGSFAVFFYCGSAVVSSYTCQASEQCFDVGASKKTAAVIFHPHFVFALGEYSGSAPVGKEYLSKK